MSQLRFSSQREKILEILSKKGQHPKAIEVYEEIKKALPRTSRATVYRNLEQLEKEGILEKIPGNPTRYENIKYNGRHAHFTCKKCGRVEDIELDKESVKKISKRISSKKIMINITGTCKECSRR